VNDTVNDCSGARRLRRWCSHAQLHLSVSLRTASNSRTRGAHSRPVPIVQVFTPSFIHYTNTKKLMMLTA